MKLELERAMDVAGLGDDYLAETIKGIIESGKGRKATASDALRAIKMVLDRRHPKDEGRLKQDYREALAGKTIDELLDIKDQLEMEKKAILGETVDEE